MKQYYFKSRIFERVSCDLPLRILVGHKGIGKSALISIAMQEDVEQGTLAILVRPDDVHEIKTDENDLLSSIRAWKSGLLRIIYAMAVKKVVPGQAEGAPLNMSTGLADSLVSVFRPLIEKAVDVEESRRKMAQGFLRTRKVRVYLDDLDRGWTASRASILRLSALLNALRDMSHDYPELQFRAALRSDVYFLVRTSDESTDKIEGAVVWHTWTNHEILAILVKRIESFLGRERSEDELIQMKQDNLASFLHNVMEPRFHGHGKWYDIPIHRMLMTLVRRRPRDMVKLCTLAAQHAAECERSIICSDDFKSAFDQYSQGRLQDTFNEYRSELSSIEPLLMNMKPSKKEWGAGRRYVYTTDQLLTKVKNIQSSYPSFRFYHAQANATPKELAAFMYKIGFVTARKEVDGRMVRRYFDDNRYLSSTFTDFGFDWEVHPAFRWALQPDSPMAIFDNVEPTDSDE